MSAARPDTWMAMYWGDYAKDTAHLSAAQHGAYLMLIKHYWVTGRPLPDDDAQLWRVACADSIAHWRRLKPTVTAFFTLEDGLWHHGRIDRELGRAGALTEQRSAAGRKSAEARKALKNNNSGSTPVEQPLPPVAAPLPTNAQRNARPSQSQSQSHDEREDAAASRARAADPSDDLTIPPPLDRRPQPAATLSPEDTALNLWNAVARDRGWPEAMFLNSTRRLALNQRLEEVGGPEGWSAALRAASDAQFLQGPDGRPHAWFDLDWFLRPSNFTRLMEGRYAQPRQQRQAPGHNERSAAVAGIAAARARRSV